MSEIDERIGRRIRELREAKGWSQQVMCRHLLAAGLNMSQQVLHKVETGTRSARMSEGAAMADALGVDIDSLIPRYAAGGRDVDAVPTAVALVDLLPGEWRRMLGAITAVSSLHHGLVDLERRHGPGLPEGLAERVRELVERDLERDALSAIDSPIMALVNIYSGGEDLRRLGSITISDPYSDEPIIYHFRER